MKYVIQLNIEQKSQGYFWLVMYFKMEIQEYGILVSNILNEPQI
jgi:hypothetical protein